MTIPGVGPVVALTYRARKMEPNENISTPNLSYAAQYLACALPCERFTSALADIPYRKIVVP
jgi:hypothetical protein